MTDTPTTPAADTPNAAQAGQSQSAQDNTGTSEGNTSNEPEKTALTQATQDETQATDKKKVDENNTPDPQKNGEGQDKTEGQDAAPETYEPYKFPENVEMDQAVVDDFNVLAKEAKLPQEQAQKFVDMGIKSVQAAVQNVYTQWTQAYADKVKAWTDTRKADSEIGGDEKAQTLALSQAARVARAVGGDAFMKALDETGAGNHPEFVRFFYRIRDVVGEDGKLITSNQGGGESKTAAQSIYPNLTSKN